MWTESARENNFVEIGGDNCGVSFFFFFFLRHFVRGNIRTRGSAPSLTVRRDHRPFDYITEGWQFNCVRQSVRMYVYACNTQHFQNAIIRQRRQLFVIKQCCIHTRAWRIQQGPSMSRESRKTVQFVKKNNCHRPYQNWQTLYEKCQLTPATENYAQNK